MTSSFIKKNFHLKLPQRETTASGEAQGFLGRPAFHPPPEQSAGSSGEGSGGGKALPRPPDQEGGLRAGGLCAAEIPGGAERRAF